MTREAMRMVAAARRQPTVRRGRRLRLLLGSLMLLVVCGVIRYYWNAAPANAESPVQPADRTTATMRPADSPERMASSSSRSAPKPSGKTTPTTNQSVPAIVATVNNQRITHDDLGRECLRHWGKSVLESMVNRRLIVQECQRQHIDVTREDVNAEIERMSKRFNIPVDQWLKLLKQERNVTPEQYANDIIWPMLALRRLAGERLAVSPEELQKEFETQYGDMVRVRLIAVSSPEKAKRLRAQAAAHPRDFDFFGNLAKTSSEDASSASVKGVINPIRRHGSYKEIEQAVFNMADGDISPVIHAGNQYVILMREGLIPAREVNSERVAPQLEEILRDRKMRTVAQDVFRQLQSKAKVDVVWSDPAKRAKMPGVAATIDGSPITLRDLADDCIAHHGQEVLDGLIHRKMIEQACKQRNITVTEADIDREIAEQAASSVKARPDGSPDVDAWLEMVTKQQGISLDVYRHDVVWPSVALKKLTSDRVKVTDDDLRKGFEANFGPRVRCLAIVTNNQRRAQQVFDLARKKNTSENFGDLAAQYSIEPGSQALRGEVPPIKRHGGQPDLEREAFSLKAGELSGIIQVGDKFILLRCEGYTNPVKVEFAKVRDELYRDIHEKKMRMAMSECFEKLQDAAVVDNYLAGTSHSPNMSGGNVPAANVPTLHQVPGG